MASAIYLINPSTDFPVYYGAEVFARLGLPPAAFMVDLTVATVAATVPEEFDVTLCDEAIAPAALDHTAGIIGITGKTSQRLRMRELAREYRRRGKLVVIGGPYASLVPEEVRPYCDILVRGELETVAETLFADLAAGRWKAEYHGEPADLATSPMPRWDLYPTAQALQGCLQTSRGCPFRCEFCDTIEYVGRRQRHKPVAAILRELEDLYRRGFRSVFLADDNFTAHRSRAGEILTALAQWNRKAPAGPVHFSTQLSVDAADHPDLLDLCSAARLSDAFVGIESPSEESLRECGKQQNLKGDLVARIETLVGHGVGVIGGLIVGFDADDGSIFQRQLDFAMQTPVPTYSVNALNAPPPTPLYQRMSAEGRLLENEHEPITPWWTNFFPARMTMEELQTGVYWLVRKLYEPEAFELRMRRFIDCYSDPQPLPRGQGGPRREMSIAAVAVVRTIPRMGGAEARMFRNVMAAARRKPQAQRLVMANLLRYVQVRAMFQPAWGELRRAG